MEEKKEETISTTETFKNLSEEELENEKGEM